MKPTFIGIGAQKCATTWIFRNLDGHPQVALSLQKELHFFSANYDRGYRWYESQFEAGPSARAVGEYSTSYLCDLDSPERVARYNPDLRLIVALRDPVDRAYSNHLHEVRVGHLGSGTPSFESCEPDNPMYLEQSCYARHLRRWLERFPREHLLVLFQEEIESDPGSQAAMLYEFLGVDASYRSPYLVERVNVSARQKSPTAKRAMQIGAGAIRSLFGERAVRNLKAFAPMRGLRRANEAKLTNAVPPLQAATRERLVAGFAQDMRDLVALVGRKDLPWRSWRELRP